MRSVRRRHAARTCSPVALSNRAWISTEPSPWVLCQPARRARCFAAFFGLGRRRVLAHELASLACEQIGRHRLGRLHQRLCDFGRHVFGRVGDDRRVFDVEPPLGQRFGQGRHLGQPSSGDHVLLRLPPRAPPDRTAHDSRVGAGIAERIECGLGGHQPLIHPRTKPLQIGDAVAQFRAR